MPVILTSFIIRQPRVSSVNAATTLPPSTQGTATLYNAFTIEYLGSATTCRMALDGNYLLTIVNGNRTHADNLSIPLAGQQLQDVVTSIEANANYAATLQGPATDRALLVGGNSIDILSGPFQVQYGKPTEYLVEADSTGKLGTVTVRWTENDFSYTQTAFQWELNQNEDYEITGELVPSNGVTSIDQGSSIVFLGNPNSTYDTGNLKTVVGEIVVNNAGPSVSFANWQVLTKMILSTLVVYINNSVAVEDINYSISVPDMRINFLKGVTNETTTLTESSAFVDTAIQGIGGVITDNMVVRENGVPKVKNIDFVPNISTVSQGKSMGSGRVFFTETFVDDMIAQYTLVTESSLFAGDLIVTQNGVPLDSSAFLLVLEAGFLNLNSPLFPGDSLAVTYRSKAKGLITDEILSGTAASITGTGSQPFAITAGENDTFIVQSGSTVETITLPIGNAIRLGDIITAYNTQATVSVAALSTDGSKMVVSSTQPGPSSTLQIMNGDANTTLGFDALSSATGAGAVGGEFAFTLAQAPVMLSTFSAPQDGDTFIIKQHDISSNYPQGGMIEINNDLYIVKSTSVINQAFLYAGREELFQISTDINDTFVLIIDGVSNTIKLTTGSRTSQNIADDINLTLFQTLATVDSINGMNLLKISSPTAGVGGTVAIGNGNANQILGFTLDQFDTGLPDTAITVFGNFKNNYSNPQLLSTRRAVIFDVETAVQDKSPPGVNTIIFNGVDSTDTYKAGVILNINSQLYLTVGSQFTDNKTTVTLGSKLVAPLYTTDTIQYTARPVFQEGSTVLSFTKKPIPSLPLTVKDNGVTLVANTDYTLNANGTITLADNRKLNEHSLITASYTAFTELPAGTVISIDYRFFSNLNEGSIVKADYQFISSDQFFYDIVYQNDLATALFAKNAANAAALQNPSSSGYPAASGGGGASNSTSGNPTPKFQEYEQRILDGIAKSVFDFLDRRVKAFTDERATYTGEVVGANSGPVTEANIQAVISSPSRLFPSGYMSLDPFRVPALDGLAQNDDGSTTGAIGAGALLSYLNPELTDISNETAQINAILAIPQGTTISATSTGTISSVSFTNGTAGTCTLPTFNSALTCTNAGGTWSGVECTLPAFDNNQSGCLGASGTFTSTTPANNVLNIYYNGTTYPIIFTGSAVGTPTPLASIISQINAVIPGAASNVSSHLVITSNSQLQILSGSANSALGLPAGSLTTTREGSAAYAAWRALVADEISKNTTQVSILGTLNSSLAVIMEEFTGIYVTSFDQAYAYANTPAIFSTATSSTLAQNQTDYVMDVQIDANLTARRDTTNPARTSTVNAYAGTISGRQAQIAASLVAEKLYDKRYAWLKFRAALDVGYVVSIKRQIDAQTKAALDAANATNSAL